MIRLPLLVLIYSLVNLNAVAQRITNAPTALLYNKVYNDKQQFPELVMNKVTHRFRPEGLEITDTANLVRLDRYYSLARRFVRYDIKFSADAKAVFQSDKGDFKAYVDVAAKKISIATQPVTEMSVSFLDAAHDYLIEIHRDYQRSVLRIIDVYTGESAEISATMDGEGGCGKGSVHKGFFVGRQYDYYCFGLVNGTSIIIRQLCVLSRLTDLKLLIYGDSITEPEGYFPSEDFPASWTQLILKNVNGPATSSGRGGTTIKELSERIKNELPYVKAKYVMITIGTNGGNTEKNLGELVEYIFSQGSIPILNNVPCNESGTQIQLNALIEKVRRKYKIRGCLFDIATSLDHDGKNVDKSTMYFEDYDWGKIYHHPNVKGSLLMYTRTLIDVPEIYY